MKICVFGAGYVGLVTACCLAELGNSVVCADVDENRVAALQRNEVPIHEPGLTDLLIRNAAAGRLRFTTDAAMAIGHGTLLFIGVGTPASEDGSADLHHVLAVAASIGRHMNDYKVIVDKSTVPVGTADRVRTTIAEELQRRAVSLPFAVVSNPEFLKEGAAIDDFLRPARVVVGSDDDLTGLCFAVWGLAFKPGTDDLREAPSLAVIDGLLERGARVRAFDPVAMPAAARHWPDRPGFELARDPLDAARQASALLIVTEWREFRSPDFADLRRVMHTPVLFDGRNLFDPALLRAQGFEYVGIGRPQQAMRLPMLLDRQVAQAA